MAVTAESPEICRLRVSTDGVSESSPPSSAESNFRDLDDAFLQTQTRIWLGEVLQIRFDEQMNISDLLADGELLFEVSEVISRMLPTSAADASNLKMNEWKFAASSKSTRRYMHYYNVGSFLRLCTTLGLNGIDLFTPSDVVEKRNTRKVCMCVRSLSKKARSRGLDVPDFDSVTCTITMPTDMVEFIRKSLELSQCSSPLPVGHDSGKVSRVRFWQGRSNSTPAVSNSYSDNCDDDESNLTVEESYGSSDYAYDSESPNIPGSQVVQDYSSALKLQLNTGDSENEDGQCEYLSPSVTESVGSPCSRYYSDQEELSSMPSSTCFGSRISGNVLDVNSEKNYGFQNGDVNHVPIDWGDCSLDIGNYRDGNANDDELDHVLFSNNNQCNLRGENSSPPSKIEFDTSSSDKVEQVSCTNLGVHLECVVENEFHADEAPLSKFESLEDEQMDSNTVKHGVIVYGKVNDNHLSSELLVQGTCHESSPINTLDSSYNDENRVSQICTDVISTGENSYCDDLNNVNDKEAVDANMITSDHTERAYDNGLLGGDSCNSTDMPRMELNSSPSVVVSKDIIRHSEKDSLYSQELSEDHNVVAESINGKPINTDVAICDLQPGDESPESVKDVGQNHNKCAGNKGKDKSQHNKKEEYNGQDIPLHKPRRDLLKSVLTGTTLLGVAALFLHLRKNSKENPSRTKKQPTEVQKRSTPKPSSEKVQRVGSTSSVYPAEKLNF